MKIQNNNKTKTATAIIAALMIGLVLSSPMTVLTSVSAQVQSSPTSGKNIVLDQPSATQVPVQKQLRDQLTNQLNTASSESAKAEIRSEIANIDTSVQQWFKNHEDPVKEKIVREKQDVLVDVLDGKTPNNGLLAQSLPWSIIGYDYSDNALEVGIIPQDFTPSAMSQYFKEIRSVVGDQIDIALSPQDSPHLTSCTGFRVACTPMEGAIQIEDTSTLMWGSIMYPAKYNNQYGFVTAGHYVNHGDSIEQPVGGSTVGTGVGTEWFNGTNCDCSFSSNSTDISGQIKGYSTTISATASPFGGMSVTMCGAGTQGCSSGSVVSTNVSVKYSPSNYVVNHLIESSYSAMDGDSGGPVVSGSDLVGDQSGKNSLNTFASPVGLIASDFSGLTWCFGC